MLAPIIRKLGANTAGVGVCFLSQRQWVKTIISSGLIIDNYTDDIPWQFPAYKKLFLHLGHVRIGHFWVSLGKD
jgi:hypothetical protein